MSRLSPFIFIILFSASIAFPQTTLYTETFSEGALDNPWYPGFGGISKSMEVKEFPSPTGDNWVGSLATDTLVSLVASSFSGDITWTNYRYEAQVYIETDSAFYYGLEIRVDSTGETTGYNYVIQANPNFGPTRIRFRRRDGSSAMSLVSIKDWTQFEIPGVIPTSNGWHKMAIEAVGNEFKIFFDDQELPGGPFVDTTYANGLIGTYTFSTDTSVNMHLKIDDIVVQTVPPNAIDKDNNRIITSFNLQQNYPNPFNPTTTIKFELPISEFVQLEVFNIVGQKISVLANRNFNAGIHQVSWQARDDLGNEVPAGVYYYRLKVGEFEQTRKMVLMK
jgi:hypothetical protein